MKIPFLAHTEKLALNNKVMLNGVRPALIPRGGCLDANIFPAEPFLTPQTFIGSAADR